MEEEWDGGAGLRTVAVVCTSRSSVSKTEPIVAALRRRADVRVWVETGYLNLDNADRWAEPYETANLAATALRVFNGAFGGNKPNIVLVNGDRFEVLAAAYAATLLNIPLAHNQGGEVTGSVDEKIRHAVTKLATLHFTATEKARERVIHMGELPSRVHHVGCPSLDSALPFRGVTRDLSQPILVLQHASYTESRDAEAQFLETLEAVRSFPNDTFWYAPNRDVGGVAIWRRLKKARVNVIQNEPPERFLQRLSQSGVLVGNSSAGIREASFLGTPAVNIGSRQNGRERSPNVCDVEPDTRGISRAIKEQLCHGPYKASNLYGDGHAAERIAELLATEALLYEKRLTF